MTTQSSSSPSSLSNPLPISLADLDRTIIRLSALVRTTSGLDTTLQTLSYTLTLLHSQLRVLLQRRLSAIASSLAHNAQKVLLPGESLLLGLEAPRSLRLLGRGTESSKRLADLIGDVRIFLRLLGLAEIYAWGRAHYESGKAGAGDAVGRAIVWAQIAACAAFQALENGAYLAQHEVLRWDAERKRRAWLWSARFWAAHVVLESGRLMRVRALRQRERRGWEETGAGGEKGEKVTREREERDWWREMWVNAAYVPLVVHWSVDGGCVSDGLIGLFGGLAGAMKFREVWKKTG